MPVKKKDPSKSDWSGPTTQAGIDHIAERGRRALRKPPTKRTPQDVKDIERFNRIDPGVRKVGYKAGKLKPEHDRKWPKSGK